MNALTYIYDVEKYDEQFRNVHKGEPLVIERPQINLLACCTPSFLTELMPAGAWEQGFLIALLSFILVILIFSLWIYLVITATNKPSRRRIRPRHQENRRRKNYRRLAFTREAAAALENWHITRHGAPDHPRLT
jgi:hypothetical protein